MRLSVCEQLANNMPQSFLMNYTGIDCVVNGAVPHGIKTPLGLHSIPVAFDATAARRDYIAHPMHGPASIAAAALASPVL